ncbi:MAG: coproporphyrinogen III oxidase family protein [Actinobacteria bacterium]|nr:coproporphyrinogen III oxidase family protein [Actinomycetota bacterium]
MKKPLQLYIHIPFCVKQCTFCDATTVTGDSSAKAEYLAALQRELSSALPALDEFTVANIYVGGGSPTVMNPDALGKLIGWLKESLHLEHRIETSIEVMPRTVGVPSLTGLSAGKFNRFSLGMQSSNPKETKALDCDYNVYDVQDAVLFLDKFHARNVNIDLMYGTPLQTPISWKTSLRTALDFEPEHLSIYPFSKDAGSCPSQVARDEMDAITQDYLKHNGYERYSLYHYSKPGYRCQHFVNRYSGVDYMGFGLGATSYVDGIAYGNTGIYADYVSHSDEFEQVVTDVVQLDETQQKKQYVINNLHLTRGVVLEDYSGRFGAFLDADFSDCLDHLNSEGFLAGDDTAIFLTEKGLRESASVFAMFE